MENGPQSFICIYLFLLPSLVTSALFLKTFTTPFLPGFTLLYVFLSSLIRHHITPKEIGCNEGALSETTKELLNQFYVGFCLVLSLTLFLSFVLHVPFSWPIIGLVSFFTILYQLCFFRLTSWLEGKNELRSHTTKIFKILYNHAFFFFSCDSLNASFALLIYMNVYLSLHLNFFIGFGCWICSGIFIGSYILAEERAELSLRHNQFNLFNTLNLLITPIVHPKSLYVNLLLVFVGHYFFFIPCNPMFFIGTTILSGISLIATQKEHLRFVKNNSLIQKIVTYGILDARAITLNAILLAAIIHFFHVLPNLLTPTLTTVFIALTYTLKNEINSFHTKLPHKKSNSSPVSTITWKKKSEKYFSPRSNKKNILDYLNNTPIRTL